MPLRTKYVHFRTHILLILFLPLKQLNRQPMDGKILIVDDNEDILFALNLLLEPYVEKVKVTTLPSRI